MVLVRFIGCPRSGKTTVAAGLFASLKESGIPAEFLPEQARVYIARMRAAGKVEMGDHQATEIMRQQFEMEKVMLDGMGEHGVLVTDSSPHNSLLYMTEAGREAAAELSTSALGLPPPHCQRQHKVITFLTSLVDGAGEQDKGRIHSESEMLSIQASIPLVIPLAVSTTFLDGTIPLRRNRAVSEVLAAHFDDHMRD